MSTDNISVNRDKENDVVYIIRTDVDLKNISNYSFNKNILIRVDAKTRKIEGLTIEAFSETFPELDDLDEYHLMESFDRTLGLMNAPHAVAPRN